MPLSAAQSTKRYYEQYPSGRHQTGDIWSEIPNNGLLPVPRTSALLITPACDLQNCKTDTLVFIPIVPLTVAVTIPSFLRRFGSEMMGVLDSLFPELSELCDFSDPDFRSTLGEQIGSWHGSPKDQVKIGRLKEWLHFCEVYEAKDSMSLPFLTAAGRRKFLEMVICNSLTADAHFFPKERWETSYPAISFHSVCLFRYLLTYPVELFDLAARTTSESWQKRLSAVAGERWAQFGAALPIRALRLRHEFLVDVITRLTSLFNRIGSDDFTSRCIAEFAEEIT